MPTRNEIQALIVFRQRIHFSITIMNNGQLSFIPQIASHFPAILSKRISCFVSKNRSKLTWVNNL